jgi:SAM-dependent methyltransferase
MDKQAYLERVSLAEGDQPIFHEHLARYQFVTLWAGGKVVMDAASGAGYGAALLAQTARYVVGVDIAREAVLSALRGFRRPDLRFVQMDCTRLGFAAATFDLVCAFEMIEHIADYRGVLREIRRILRPAGTLVLSTPNRRPEDPVPPANPYHVQEFSSEEFEALLRGFFPQVELYGQRGSERVHAVRYGTPLKQRLRPLDPLGLRRLLPGLLYRGLHRLIRAPLPQDLRPSDYSITREGFETADFLVAVCVNG